MVQATPADRLTGQMLADTYRLVRLIGEGGMGKVYEAIHLRVNRRVAVKVLLPGAAENPTTYARFRREAEIATELGHPHIVQVLDFNVTDDGQPYLVMELLEGIDLMTRLQHAGRLPAPELLAVLDQVASALQAAHARQIVHRDLKPENIFLVDGRQGLYVKLLDFGLSKIKHGGKHTALTLDNTIFGTPSYMSPEQAEGMIDEIDHTTDIFALGVISYHCLTGLLPFDGPSVPGILYNICHVEPRPARDLLPQLPAAADAVLARAMAKRKVDRYQDVGAFVADLQQALAGLPVALAGAEHTPRVQRVHVDVGPTLPPMEAEELLEADRTREHTLTVRRPRSTRRVRLMVGAAVVMLLALGAMVTLLVIDWDAPPLALDSDPASGAAAPRPDVPVTAPRLDRGAPDARAVAEAGAAVRVDDDDDDDDHSTHATKAKKGKRARRSKRPATAPPIVVEPRSPPPPPPRPARQKPDARILYEQL